MDNKIIIEKTELELILEQHKDQIGSTRTAKIDSVMSAVGLYLAVSSLNRPDYSVFLL